MPPEPDPGYGPPPGNPSGPARDGGSIPFDALARSYISGLEVNTNDPAFRGLVTDPADTNTRARAELIYRDVPLVTIQNTWSIEEARSAMYAHILGQFYTSGMLCDSVLGDDRVTATLNSRASAVLGREVRFEPADTSSAARECCDAWAQWWPRLSGDATIREMQDYSCMMGFSHSQILWHMAPYPGLAFGPTLRFSHPVFEWYDWVSWKFTAIGQDGMIPIVPGNGKWVELAPYSSYRCWMRGALRPVIEPWMLRHFGFRDMARFGEVHGNPTRVGYVPIVGDPTLRQEFKAAIAKIGADTGMIVPRGVESTDGLGYDFKLVEATSRAWEVHPAQIDRCDMAIVLALLMVSLETEVSGGGAWGSKAKMDIRSEGAQLDNQSLRRMFMQVARPFALLNFGDANLAPWTSYDVVGRDEYANNAKQFQAFGTGIEVLRRGGVEFEDPEAVRQYAAKRFGLAGLPKFKIVPPVAGKGGGGGGAGEGAGGGSQ